MKWSQTQIEWNPACSARRPMSARCRPMSSGPPDQSNSLISSPNFTPSLLLSLGAPGHQHADVVVLPDHVDRGESGRDKPGQVLGGRVRMVVLRLVRVGLIRQLIELAEPVHRRAE